MGSAVVFALKKRMLLPVFLALISGAAGILVFLWWLDLFSPQPMRSHEEFSEYSPRSEVTQRDWWHPQPGYRPPMALGRADVSTTEHINPMGRTGLEGRGIMPAHGDNVCTMPFVLRYNNDLPYVLLIDGKLPGWRRFVRNRESCYDTLLKNVFIDADNTRVFFEGPQYTLACAALDSCLNTDNAWMSVDVYLVLLEDYIRTRDSECTWVPLYRAVRDEYNEGHSEGHASVLSFCSRRAAAMAAEGQFDPLETRETMNSDCGSDESAEITDGEPGPDVCGGPEEVGDSCSEGGSDADEEGSEERDGSRDPDSTNGKRDA